MNLPIVFFLKKKKNTVWAIWVYLNFQTHFRNSLISAVKSAGILRGTASNSQVSLWHSATLVLYALTVGTGCVACSSLSGNTVLMFPVPKPYTAFAESVLEYLILFGGLNSTVLLIPFSDCSLQIYINTTDFYIDFEPSNHRDNSKEFFF